MTSPALSFGPAAELYDAIRPAYPAAAVAWAIGSEPRRVLDLGAGTGRLTGVLLAAGHEVVSVEPDEQMLAVLRGRHPRATAATGSAESIPLPDGGADAVVCGQAYHWFDRETALPEIARVLAPGGTFAPMWNLRDDDVAWVGAYTALVGSEGAGLDRAGKVGDYTPWFGESEYAQFEHTVAMTPDGLVDLLRSRSYYLTAAPERRAVLERSVRDLAATHPDLAGKAQFDLPYRTEVYRARKNSSSGV